MDFKEFVTGKPTSRRSKLLQYWQTLRPDMPISLTPISRDHTGSTKDDDGIRLTGSPQFIASVISRLKEILMYESPRTKIEIVYRQSEAQQGGQSKPSYVMYIQVKERSNPTDGLRKPKLPEPPKVPKPK